MGIWLELGVFLVILLFGVWQLYDVKKAIREREQRKTKEHESAAATPDK
jgi:ABC-type nickel/cobalt efflux system permease component RcnA